VVIKETDPMVPSLEAVPPIRLLLVEDDPGDALLLRLALEKVPGTPILIEHVARLAAARERLQSAQFDVVFLDLSLPDSLGMDTFRAARQAAPNLPIVIVSGHDDETVAIRAVNLGAQDYLVKGATSEVLVRSIRYAIERRRLLNQVEQASGSKSEFLTRLAHELRTPLHSVLGFAQLLQLESQSPEQADKIDCILTAGRHIEKLIREVLDTARVEAGKVDLHIESIQPLECVREAVALVSPLARSRNVTMTVLETQPCPNRVAADRTRLLQILLNLLSNAIKYGREGGNVELSCEHLESLRLLVRDDGPGIKLEDQSKMFLPFERLQADRGKVEGSGVGLTVSQNLARLMGGDLGVISSGGNGSTFWVDLACDQG
jgi:signal transduction histidine kinase